MLDGAAPFVRNYETSDGKFLALCAIERRFYTALLRNLDIADIDPADQYKTEHWDRHTAIFSAAIKRKNAR